VSEGRGTRTSSEPPPPPAVETLGRYLLLDRLGEGGMAEVFKAKSPGVEGFEKVLVIKRILPRLARHAAFVKMFVHEAKLAVRLSHANIVQVFDLGKVERGQDESPSYFIAMEYVAGLDLASLLDGLKRGRRGSEQRLPIGAVVYLCAEIAKALDHAHRRVDEKGRPLGIVHSDISPHNVLVSWDGDVKVTDFGIARANDAVLHEDSTPDAAAPDDEAEHLVAVRVSGKVAYMSPEQSRGDGTDPRSDLFSLGVVLYQMLVGANPFAAPSLAETSRRVAAAEVPPLTLARPDVPPALVGIVERLLRREPADRYLGAAELYEDLLAFAYTSGERFGAGDLADVLAPLRAREIEPDAEVDSTVGDVLSERASADARTPVEVPSLRANMLDEPLVEPERGDRREVTVLVITLEGDGERVMAEASPRSTLREQLERQGAWLERHSPTELIALFGLGDTDGRDGEAAVRAALSFVRESEVARKAGVGVHSGPISVDEGGLPLRDARLDALVSMAARLAAVAGGQVALSPVTARLVRRSFVTEAFTPDRSALVEGFTARGPLAFEGAKSRFVGRRQELQRLGSILATATRGEPQLLFVQGKTGVGKSRFLFEAGRRLERGQFRVAFHSATCPPNGATEPWSALRELIHALCGTQPDDDVQRILDTRPRLRALGLDEQEADSILALVGAPMNVPAAEFRAGVRAGFERMVKSLCKERLHCFAFDDAQAVDAETYDAVLRIVQRTKRLRAVFLLSQRGDADLDAPHTSGLRALEGKRRLQLLELGELREREVAELIEQQLGARALPAPLLNYVRRCAGGHPLFVEELVRELCDTGLVQVVSGAASLRSDEQATAPRTLRNLIADRVSRLPQRERRVLQGLAVLGEPASLITLAEALDQLLPSIDRHVSALEQKGLVARTGTHQARFASPLYQEIILDAMAASVRVELHSAAAAVYAKAPAGVGDAAERLASHLHAAGDRAGAVSAYWRAGNERRAAGQVEAAVRAMTRGAELSNPSEFSVDRLVGWLADLGAAVAQARNAPGLREAVGPLLRDVKVRAKVHLRVRAVVEAARCFASVNLFEDGVSLLEELASWRSATPDAASLPVDLDAAVLSAECELAARQGRIEQAIAASERLDALGLAPDARTRFAMTVAYASGGNTARALQILADLEAESLDLGVGFQVSLAKHRTIVHFNQRDFAAAAREAGTTARLALSAGLRFEAALALHNLGDACDRLGDHPRAYAAFVESLELSRQLEHDRLSNVNQLHLCMLDGLRSSEGVEEKLKALIRYADARGYLWDVIEGRYLLARLHVAHGVHERARKLLEDVLANATEHRHGLIAADARELLTCISPRRA